MFAHENHTQYIFKSQPNTHSPCPFQRKPNGPTLSRYVLYKDELTLWIFVMGFFNYNLNHKENKF